jgi:hypothetical protein
MPARKAHPVTKVAAVIFTSLVAPTVVSVVGAVAKDAGAAAPSVATAAAVTQPSAVGPTIRVSARGAGRTADDALQDAVCAAVRHALAGEVDSATLASRGPVILAEVRGGGKGVVRNWREVAAKRVWRLSGTAYQSDVEVDVDRAALVARVAVVGAPVRIGPPVPGRPIGREP